MSFSKGIIFFTTPLFFLACTNNVEKTKPTIETITESVYASGEVKSLNQYQVYSTVNGLISDLLVTEGDLVKKGDSLMVIRNEPSALNSENALLAANHAEIQANKGKLKEAKVAIDLAYSKMQNDSLLLNRQRKLHNQEIGSEVEFETRELNYKSSLANYQVSLLNYSELKKDLAFLSEQAQNNLKISKALAEDYLIRAESDGRVYKVLKERGELVNAASPVAIIGAADTFIIELNIDEFDISRIHVGQEVLISMDSYKGEVYTGRVLKIEPLMDENSRSFTVKAVFVTQPPALYPNLSVEANIVIRSKVKALTIPRSYLLNDTMVIVNKDEKRKVETGIKDYNRVEILSGLSENDVIYKAAQ